MYVVKEMATILILEEIIAPKAGNKNFQELVIRMQLEVSKNVRINMLCKYLKKTMKNC